MKLYKPIGTLDQLKFDLPLSNLNDQVSNNLQLKKLDVLLEKYSNFNQVELLIGDSFE